MRAVMLLVALLIGCVAPLHAADDVAAAQSAIRSQVEALQRDDAATAYSYAAPALQRMFRDPDTFMGMVRSGYAPVVRHKSFEFGEGHAADGQIVQHVDIVDADGAVWDALYTLAPQPDGSLKITGCTLVKAGQAV